jgi:putative peptidoglycan lipid II flippase
MVAYASWSNLRAEGRIKEARLAVDQSLRWVIALAAPVLAGLFIGRHVIIEILFEHGQFTTENTVHTASVLGWYLPGVLTNLVGILVVRAHVVEHNLRLILIMGAVCMVSNATLNAVLIGPMGLNGLALATTLNMIVVPGLFLWALRSVLPWPRREWFAALGIALASIAVAAGVELGPGHPLEISSGVLWLASVPCFLLLGLGWHLTRPGQSP